MFVFLGNKSMELQMFGVQTPVSSYITRSLTVSRDFSIQQLTVIKRKLVVDVNMKAGLLIY